MLKSIIKNPAFILVALGSVVFLLIVVMLSLQNFGVETTYNSEEHGYTIKFNSNDITYETILLDGKNRIYMDRFLAVKNRECYISVTSIGKDTNLEETLENFQSDGSYSFTIDEQGIYGAGNYPARAISYEDKAGKETLQVTYYYDEAHGIFVTVCTDEKNRKLLSEVLKALTIKE